MDGKSVLELNQATAAGRDAERRRCVGLVLRHVGLARLRGDLPLATFLDALATELEHGLIGGADLTRALDPERW